jgi:outer membrane lipoprotein-sorting protein
MRKVYAAALFLLLLSCPVNPRGLSAAAFSPEAPFAGNAQLVELAQKFSRISGIRSSFTQTRYVSFLDEQVVSEGFFEFRKPDTLIWQYTAPAFFRLEYAGGKAGFRNTPSGPERTGGAASRQEADLAARVGRNVLMWIALDLEAIQRTYTIKSVQDRPLSLLFEIKKPVAGSAQRISLLFAENGLDVREILLEEADGDYIRLEFSNSEHYE